MTKQDLKQLAFDDLYSSVKYADMDAMNIDGLNGKEIKTYIAYFESFKKKLIKQMDNMPI